MRTRSLIFALFLLGSTAYADFPNGLAAGDVAQDSVILWARSSTAGTVSFVVVERGSWLPVVRTASVNVTDPAIPAKAEIGRLRAGARYMYTAIGPDGARARGFFRTSNTVGTRVGLRFGVSGDWRGELSPYPSVANARARNLDFFVALGDTIYADVPSDAVPAPQAKSITEYRAKHGEVYSSKAGLNALGDLRQNTAVFAIIDDHEVTNDFAGGAPAASDPRFESTTAPFINETTLYRTGLQAFHEFNPIRSEIYPASNDARLAGKPKLYRYRTFGSDAAIVLLDARSFRDLELTAANPTNAADVARFLLESFDIDPATQRPKTTQRTMLGAQQLADMKRDLLDAQARSITWKFVFVPEPIQNLGPVAASDRFEGYARERTEILDFIQTNSIRNVVFVSADVHGTVINNLTYQRQPGGQQVIGDAFEVITGAVAYDAPFGPTVIGLARALNLVDAQTFAFYQSLPVANDADDTPNDKDDLIKGLLNQQLALFGYDPIGLAGSPISATLEQGDYVAVHTYGWTEFEIDQSTQRLRVTTYGIAPYTRSDVQANPTSIVARTPAIVSRFTVTPR